MKNYFIIPFLITATCFSQAPNDKEILQSAINAHDNFPTVICMQSDGYKKLQELVSGQKLFSRHEPENSVELTDDELVFITNEISKNQTYVFPKNTFPNALLISKDTLKSYSLNKEKSYYKERDLILKAKDTLKYRSFINKKPYPGVVTYVAFFSKPIYFRDNTLCLFYYSDLCNFHNGLGGCEEVFIYKKTQDGWKKQIAIPIGCY
jgi:hypothetical protein